MAVEESTWTTTKNEVFYLAGAENLQLSIYHYASTSFALNYAKARPFIMIWAAG